MELSFVCDDGQGVFQVALSEARETLFHIRSQVRIVNIPPGKRGARPGQDVFHGDRTPQFVIRDALEVRVGPEQRDQVRERGAELPGLICLQVEACHPLARFSRDRLELVHGGEKQLRAHLGQIGRPGGHLLIRGCFTAGRALRVAVQLSKLVEAYQVESVAQLLPGRV